MRGNGNGKPGWPEPTSGKTLEQVKTQLRDMGLEACEMIVGIDFTRSNTWNGKRTFRGGCSFTILFVRNDKGMHQGDHCTPSMVRPTPT